MFTQLAYVFACGYIAVVII